MDKIEVPNWMKKEEPVSAYVCELINAALVFDPKMTLQTFAETLDAANKQWSYERIREIVMSQFEHEGGQNVRG